MGKLVNIVLFCGFLLGIAGRSEALVVGDYKLGFSKDMNPHAVLHYDMANESIMTGASLEILWWMRRGEKSPIAYFAGNHLYELRDKAKGSLGATVGVNTGQASTVISNVAPILVPKHSRRLKWLTAIGQYASLEVGGGYRALGPEPRGGDRWYWSLGGKVRIPINEIISKILGSSEK